MKILQLAENPRIRMVVRFVFGLAVMELVGAALHELLIFGAASLLSNLNIDVLTEQIHALPFDIDEVHVHLVLSTLTAVHPRGIAVAGPPGELLHFILPSLFLTPTRVPSDAAISAVLSRGSSLPALFITRVMTQVLLIVLGSLCVRIGIRSGRGGYLLQHPRFALSWIAAFGFFLQAQATCAVIRMTPPAPELDYMGIGIIADNLLGNTGSYDGMIDQILPAAIALAIILAAFSIVPVFAGMATVIQQAWRVFRLHRVGASWESHPDLSLTAMRQFRLIGFLVMLVLAAILPTSLLARTNLHHTQLSSPTEAAAAVRTRAKPSAIPVESALVATVTPTPLSSESPIVAETSATATPLPTRTAAPSTNVAATAQPAMEAAPTSTPPAPSPFVVERSTEEPRVIRIHWSPARKHFVLTDANGELVMLRGVNYNTHYTTLPKDEHVKILRRDLGLMRASGVNVITGYATFNEVTLEVAQEYGIFVIMPYVLDLNGDYMDVQYREQVKAEFTAFIRRYENYSSLLMWNFDDEPVHNMQERFQRPPEQVQAFADLLFELSAHAYQTDRYHRPSWLKEPRDWYLDIYENSINKARQEVQNAAAQGVEIPDPNRYAIMARSAYGTPLDINEWLPKLDAKIESDLKMPFAIGEYGVLGMDANDRGLHLAEIWSEAHNNSVLGSAVYTFGPFQPDPGDPTPPDIAAQLMLVDENAIPIDDAWGRLTQLWLAQQTEENADRGHSSIPLGTPIFQNLYDQFGGYPTSGPITEDQRVRQFFVEGKQEGKAIAYVLEWDGVSESATFQVTDQVTFEELGDYLLKDEFLIEYMEHGGYTQFGAPITNPHEITRDGQLYTAQEFVKGWMLVQQRPNP